MWLGKDQQVAQALRSLIASGEWGTHLPGYRTLEQRLDVHRETIEKAFVLLEAEGLIGPAMPGKRREILVRADRPLMSDSRRVLMIGPRPIHECSPNQRTVLLEILRSAENQGWSTSVHHAGFEFPRRSVNAIKRLVADLAPARVLLVSPSPAVEKWADEAEVPCFRVGGTISVSIRTPGVAVSFASLVCGAAERLWACGHRRLMIPIVSGKEALRSHTLEQSAAGWARGVPRIELEAMFPDQGEWLPDVLKAFWAKHLARIKPTAIIVKESNEFFSLSSYCHKQGIRIPQDLSVIQLSGDPGCLWLDPVPDRFDFPDEEICRRVIHWLNQPPVRDGGMMKLAATYVPGGTVATLQ